MLHVSRTESADDAVSPPSTARQVGDALRSLHENGWLLVLQRQRRRFVMATLVGLLSATAHGAVLDVDANGTIEPLTDGTLLIRTLFGFSGASVTNGVLGTGATRTDPVAIAAYVSSNAAALDVDRNNVVEPLTDGVLIVRYLFGFRGNALISGSVGVGATAATSAAIEGNIADSAATPTGVLGLPTFPTVPTYVAPGTTAALLGAPSSVKFNGLDTIADTLHHRPKHAIDATWTSIPAALGNALPSISDVSVLSRRDSTIIYVPAVRGAADYRAYIYDASKVTFASGRPRGAVVACAGYRQRFMKNVDAVLAKSRRYFEPIKSRELLQAIEVPGLVVDGSYKIIVEAIASPCPFPGVLAHTNAMVPLLAGGTFSYRSFDDMKQIYGNEIINGQGSALSDYKVTNAAHTAPSEAISAAVPPNDAAIPADPVVIARSAITVIKPAADEQTNAPNFDIGANAIVDEFATDGVMHTLVTGTRGEGAGLATEGEFGNWFFWTSAVQQALTLTGTEETGADPKGVQIWRRHGRLYTTFADRVQCCMSTISFVSTKTRPQQLDTTKYVHSFFRVDSAATARRYWFWMMCGGATRDELVDPATGIPRGRPIPQPAFQAPGGRNPSAPVFSDTLTPYHDKECLNLIQLGSVYPDIAPVNVANSYFDEPHAELHAFVSPAGVERGVINLKPSGEGDVFDADASGGMFWRLNAQKQATQPMFEPFDQLAPLTHYDVFVRPDRVIFYVNGRQSFCADLTDRPLQMKYGMIVYGSLLYHTTAEIETDYVVFPSASAPAVGGSTHYVMNTPWSDTRAWDSVGHADFIAIPTQLTFDASTCFKPSSTAIR